MNFDIPPEQDLENIEGLDFSKAQLDDYVRAYQEGRSVEFESFSPYIADYNLATGEIDQDNLTNTDQIGLAVARMLREKFANARMISLYDEYNTDMPDSSDVRGLPHREMTDDGGRVVDEKSAPQIELDPATKERFVASIKDTLEANGVIDSTQDREGENYLLVSESEKISDAEELIARLEAANPDSIQRNGEEIIFINPDAENQEYAEITLRNKSGRWMCEALDASSYVKTENLEISHLVVLPKSFKAQQDKVWEVLRSLGIEPTNYHNIFFDEDADPEQVVRVIEEQINKYL